MTLRKAEIYISFLTEDRLWGILSSLGPFISSFLVRFPNLTRIRTDSADDMQRNLFIRVAPINEHQARPFQENFPQMANDSHTPLYH